MHQVRNYFESDFVIAFLIESRERIEKIHMKHKMMNQFDF